MQLKQQQKKKIRVLVLCATDNTANPPYSPLVNTILIEYSKINKNVDIYLSFVGDNLTVQPSQTNKYKTDITTPKWYQQSPFPNQRFDIIINEYCPYYFPTQTIYTMAFFANMRHLLVPGGQYYFPFPKKTKTSCWGRMLCMPDDDAQMMFLSTTTQPQILQRKDIVEAWNKKGYHHQVTIPFTTMEEILCFTRQQRQQRQQ
jgi:SAM-dependent methyltransferase